MDDNGIKSGRFLAEVVALAEALARPASLEDISNSVLDRAKRLTGSPLGYVGYIDPATGHLVCPTMTREVWDLCQVRGKDIVLKEFGGLCGWVLKNRRPLLTNDPAGDPRSAGVPWGHLPIRRFLSAPALIEEEVVGQVALANAGQEYDQEDLTVVRCLAALFALAVQRQRQEKILAHGREEPAGAVREKTAEPEGAGERRRGEIEERRPAEAAAALTARQWQQIFDAINDPVAVLDLEQRVVGANLAMREMFPGREVLGRLCFELFHGADRPIADCPAARLLAEGRPARLEMREERLGGRWFEVQTFPVHDCRAVLSRIVHIVRDITDRRLVEDRLQESLREKELLLREIHHRVKNNMQVISSLLSLQARAVQDEAARQAFQESQGRIQAMAIIHEALHLSQSLASVNLRDYLSRLLHHLVRVHRPLDRLIRLETDLTEIDLSVDQAVPCGLVLNELVSNSLKYAFPAGLEGCLRVSARPAGPGRLELVVADDGVGLPGGYDWREAKTLGLQIVRNLVERQLDGTIEQESLGGVRFVISFAVDKANTTSQPGTDEAGFTS